MGAADAFAVDELQGLGRPCSEEAYSLLPRHEGMAAVTRWVRSGGCCHVCAGAGAVVNTDIAGTAAAAAAVVHVMTGNEKEGVNGWLRIDWGRVTDWHRLGHRLGLESDYRPDRDAEWTGRMPEGQK